MSRLTRTPSEPTTTRRPPRFGMISPDQEHVLLVYASFTSNNSLPLCQHFHARKRWNL